MAEPTEGEGARRGRGRPRSDRTSVVRIRVTDAEAEAFKRTAEKLGVKPVQLHRRIVRELGGRGVVELFPPDGPAISEAAKQLAAVGRNLNQIAKAVNRGSAVIDADTREDLERTLTEVRRTRDAVREVLKRSRTRSQTFTRPIPGMDPRP